MRGGCWRTCAARAQCAWGDIRFHLDGSRSPAFYGTGTEDYYHQASWPNIGNHTAFHGCVGDVAAEARAAGGGKTFYNFPPCQRG